MTKPSALSQFFNRLLRRPAPEEPAPPPPAPPRIEIGRDADEQQTIAAIDAALAKGADVNAKDFGGETALHRACYRGFAAAAQRLLDSNADINAKGVNERTPFMEAASGGNPDLLRLLIARGADIHAKDKFGSDALHQFVHWHNYDATKLPGYVESDKACLQLLLDNGFTPGDWEKSDIYTQRPHLIPLVPELQPAKALEEAAGAGDKDAVLKMMQAGVAADANVKYGGQAGLAIAAAKNDLGMMELLMTFGADVNSWSQGMTPVMAAAQAGSEDAFLRLLGAGADTSKLYTYDRYPDTTLAELAGMCKANPGMRAFVENALAHPPPPDPPEKPAPDVEMHHAVKLEKPLRFRRPAAIPA